MRQKRYKNFCYLPFRELYFDNVANGRFNSCCSQEEKHYFNIFESDEDYHNSPTLEKVRQEFLEGKKPNKCSRCWSLEDKGIESYRQIFNKGYEHEKPRKIFPILKVLDIRLSNKCNLQCRMCGPDSSDQIARKETEMFKKGIISHDQRTKDIHNVSDDVLERIFEYVIQTPSIKQIKLAGGEPMIMPEVENFTKKLVAAGRTDLELFILTNATTVKTSVINTLEKFDSVEISCSIDGVGKWIEYQRYPAKWETIRKNYEKLVNSNLNITLTPTWTQFNLLGIVEYFEWLATTKVNRLAFNEVTYPSHVGWELVPIKYRQKIIDKLDTIVLPEYAHKNYIEFFNRIKTIERPITEYEKEKLKLDVKKWDYKSNLKYRDLFPWASELLGEKMKYKTQLVSDTKYA